MPSAPLYIQRCSVNVLLPFIFYRHIDFVILTCSYFSNNVDRVPPQSLSSSVVSYQHCFYCDCCSGSSPMTVFIARRGIIY
jgi:hypothetical protein